MGVAGRRLDLGVPQQLTDRRQTLAERQGARREAVAKVMDAHVVELRALPHPIPVIDNVGEAAARFASGDRMSADLAATGASPPANDSDSADGADFDAVYNGIGGTVFCAADDCKTDADGNLTGSWYFTPTDGDELYIANPDEAGSYVVATMYARYGYWLTYDGNGDATAVNTFASTTANMVDLNLAGEGDPVADVTAEYDGDAVGISETDGRSGGFTATVNLTATFGAAPMLGGTISDFVGDAVGNWTVMLEDTALNESATFASPGATYGGTAAGAWTAQGYGPAQTPAENGNPAVNHRPEGFFGRFNANFSDGSAAGAYATRAAE